MAKQQGLLPLVPPLPPYWQESALVRIPKLKYRYQADAVSPAWATQAVGSAPDASTPCLPPPLERQPSHLSPSASPDSSVQLPAQASRRNESLSPAPPPEIKKPKGRSKILNFLTIREPSTAAFTEFQDQEKRLTALKGSHATGVSAVSQQKLPDYVPKVNSRWDGLPAVAHERGRGQWKHSSDSRRSRPAMRSSRSGQSSAMASSRPSYAQNTPSQRSSDSTSDGANYDDTHPHLMPEHLEQRIPFLDNHQSLTSNQPLRSPSKDSHKILQDPVVDSVTRLRIAEPTQRSDISLCIDLSKPSTEVEDAHRSDATPESPDLTSLRHDELSSSGSHTSEPVCDDDTAQSQPAALREVETPWPLPAMLSTGGWNSLECSVLTPPIPRKSAARQPRYFDLPHELPSSKATASAPSSPSSSSPRFEPADSTVGRSVRNFARPFANPYARPPSGNGARLKRHKSVPTSMHSARSPVKAIGRPITKESPLPPILESDAASILSVQRSRESELFEPTETRPTMQQTENGCAYPEVPLSLSAEIESTAWLDKSGPYQEEHEVHGPFAEPTHCSIVEPRSSVSSEVSVQSAQTPRERLGLGGFIKHNRNNVPWPVGAEEDLHFVVAADDGGGSDMERERHRGRNTLLALMRR